MDQAVQLALLTLGNILNLVGDTLDIQPIKTSGP